LGNEFVHLHVHSDYSILDSSISATELAEGAAEKGMTAMALTDHGNVFGHTEFYKACKDNGVKPILGSEFYVARRSRLEPMNKHGGNPTDHMVLLAKNLTGYRNILRLTSLANQEGFHYTPRIDLDLLARHSEGIIGLTACLSGAVNRQITGWDPRNPKTKEREAIPPNFQGALEYAVRVDEILGRNNFFLEVQNHVGPHQDDALVARQRDVAHGVFDLSRRTGIPMVCTNDIHFRLPEDAGAREMAMQLARRKAADDQKELVSHAGEFYLKSPDEMALAFANNPELMSNTLWIAEQCNVELPLGKYHFARPINAAGQEMTDAEIMELWEGLLAEGIAKRYPNADAAVKQRVALERETIEKMGFVPYFVIVADFVNWARDRGIGVGPARGSVGGCLIAYVLGITTLDPLRYALFFERFLNPERISMPDIDIDFDRYRVHEVIDYVVKKYGKDRVARISTFGALWAKSVIREVGKILEIAPEEINDLAGAIPDAGGEFRITINDALGQNPKAPELAVPEIKALAASADPKKKMLLEICGRLEGIKRSISTHACGIVIGDKSLEEYVALRPVDQDNPTGLLQCEADLDSLDLWGLLKFDFLALANLSAIAMAQKFIFDRHGKRVAVENDDQLDDPEVYKLISTGRTIGMFQIESLGMREFTIQVAPESIEDLSCLIALYRPGPLDAVDSSGLNMAEHYALRKAGAEPVSYMHPLLEPILKNTYGIIVYQEQIMQLASALCGYSLAQADNLRKAIGKKKPELIAKERSSFIPAAVKVTGMDEKLAVEIWDQVETFARYGFNKAHSVGYGKLVYHTAWLLKYYPLEFLTACMSVMGLDAGPPEFMHLVNQKPKSETDLAKYVDAATRFGIRVLAPDVQVSEAGCVPEGDNAIRVGLLAIKGVSSAAYKVCAARSACGSFKDFGHFVRAVHGTGVVKSVIESLIVAGACDSLAGGSATGRAALLAALDPALKAARKEVEQLPTLVEFHETLPNVPPIPERTATVEALNLVGVYCLESLPPGKIGLLCVDQESALEVAKIVAQNPGNVPVILRLVNDGLLIDVSLGQCSGTDDVIDLIKMHAKVKVT
jgi:DNA polymerase-3 subunit alpha